jgi:hypothetical protein
VAPLLETPPFQLIMMHIDCACALATSGAVSDAKADIMATGECGSFLASCADDIGSCVGSLGSIRTRSPIG